MDKDFLILNKIFAGKPFEVVKERYIDTGEGTRTLVVFRGDNGRQRSFWGVTWETQRGGEVKRCRLKIAPYFGISLDEAKTQGSQMLCAIKDKNRGWWGQYKRLFGLELTENGQWCPPSKMEPTVGEAFYRIIGRTPIETRSVYEEEFCEAYNWLRGILDEPIKDIPHDLLLKFTHFIFDLDRENLFNSTYIRTMEAIFKGIKDEGLTEVNLADGVEKSYRDLKSKYDVYKKLLSEKNFQILLARVEQFYNPAPRRGSSRRRSPKHVSLRLACALKIQTYIFLDTKKLLELRWENINTEQSLLNIGQEQESPKVRLPLPKQVMAILNKLKRLDELNHTTIDSLLVFHSKDNEKKSIGINNYRKRLASFIDADKNVSMINDVFREFARFFFTFDRYGDMDGFSLADHLGIKAAPYEAPEDLSPEEKEEWLLDDMRGKLEFYASLIDSWTKEGLKELDKITKN